MGMLAERVRDALVGRFGPSWAAKTTEEIVESTTLIEAIGRERVEPLVRFLHESDRAKFAPLPHDEAAQRERWEGWVDEFVASLDAVETSSSTGR